MIQCLHIMPFPVLYALEDFLINRLRSALKHNVHGGKESKAMQEALGIFTGKAKELKITLSPEQKRIFTDCENSYSLLEGELIQCYYRAGFSDAVVFLMGWQNRDEIK